MTILVINNYFKKENLSKAVQITHALSKVGKSKHEIWAFSEISEKKIQDYALLTLRITLVVLGIILGDDCAVGYSFIGVGVLLSIISAVRGLRKK